MSFVGGEHPGGLSELVAVPAGNALPLDPAVPMEVRVLIEPLAVGVHAAARSGAGPDDDALVIGAGPIGLFTALALRHRGVEQILLADVSDDRLALARRLGAGETVNSAQVPLRDGVRERLRPEGADLAFDCVGRQETAADALAATGKGGRTVLVGIMPAELTVDGVALQRGERAMIGVQQSTREDFATAMAILAGGGLPSSADLIRRYPLEDAAAAFAALVAGRTDVLKRVVALRLSSWRAPAPPGPPPRRRCPGRRAAARAARRTRRARRRRRRPGRPACRPPRRARGCPPACRR